jgi:hypothetical protein
VKYKENTELKLVFESEQKFEVKSGRRLKYLSKTIEESKLQAFKKRNPIKKKKKINYKT